MPPAQMQNALLSFPPVLLIDSGTMREIYGKTLINSFTLALGCMRLNYDRQNICCTPEFDRSFHWVVNYKRAAQKQLT